MCVDLVCIREKGILKHFKETCFCSTSKKNENSLAIIVYTILSVDVGLDLIQFLVLLYLNLVGLWKTWPKRWLFIVY